MMLRCLILILTISVSALCSYAQGTSETDTYKAFKRKALLQYGDFRQQANEQYAEFLKKAWNTFKAEPAFYALLPVYHSFAPFVFYVIDT